MSEELSLSVQDVIVQGAGNIVSDMDGEKVMLSVQNGKYYNLGAVGGRIWELLDAPTTITDIVGILTQEYEIEPSVCEQQVQAFVNQLHQEGLIELR